MICPGCGAEVPHLDVFCEACGHRLQPAPPEEPTCGCGAALAEADEEGFCPGCGKRVRRPASDHVEEALSADFAGISDRGLQHRVNEDRFVLIQEEQGWAAVVCDGVSSTREAEIASSTVTAVAGEVLRCYLRDTGAATPEQSLQQALAAGRKALTERRTGRSDAEGPSTTVVAALLQERQVTVAWAGDSRAYWIDADGVPEQLTSDHSWLSHAVSEGGLTAEEAEAAPAAHAILRWISGEEEAVGDGPEIVSRPLSGPGSLLLCTDGLWNYAASAEGMRSVLDGAAGDNAAERVQQLVAFALAQGGQDNITAVLLRWSPPGVAAIEPAPEQTRMEDEGTEDAAGVQG